jgi:hypothetical protein
MEQIKIAIRYFLSDGKTHTIEEVKAEISRIIGAEAYKGEVDSIFAELHNDTIVSQRITGPNGNSTSWVKAI